MAAILQLQRAIQASLADQGTSNGVVAQPAPVHREEVAFSPLALGANSLQHTAGLEALDSPGQAFVFCPPPMLAAMYMRLMRWAFSSACTPGFRPSVNA